MDDGENFLPRYFKNPARFQRAPQEVKCRSIGLSFFSSEENARRRFEVLTARMLEAVKFKLGKNLAEGTIHEKDGSVNLPDERGHFTLHPFTTSDLAAQFTIIGEL